MWFIISNIAEDAHQVYDVAEKARKVGEAADRAGNPAGHDVWMIAGVVMVIAAVVFVIAVINELWEGNRS